MATVAKDSSRWIAWLAMPVGIALVAGVGSWLRALDRKDRDAGDLVFGLIVFVGFAAIGLNLLMASWKPKSPAPAKQHACEHGPIECRRCRHERVLYGPGA